MIINLTTKTKGRSAWRPIREIELPRHNQILQSSRDKYAGMRSMNLIGLEWGPTLLAQITLGYYCVFAGPEILEASVRGRTRIKERNRCPLCLFLAGLKGAGRG